MSRSGQEIKKCFKKLDVPVKVLGRDMELAVNWNVDMGIPKSEAIKFETLWHCLMLEEAKISTQGQYMNVAGSKHSIYRTNPEIVVKAINDVIEESK